MRYAEKLKYELGQVKLTEIPIGQNSSFNMIFREFKNAIDTLKPKDLIYDLNYTNSDMVFLFYGEDGGACIYLEVIPFGIVRIDIQDFQGLSPFSTVYNYSDLIHKACKKIIIERSKKNNA